MSHLPHMAGAPRMPHLLYLAGAPHMPHLPCMPGTLSHRLPNMAELEAAEQAEERNKKKASKQLTVKAVSAQGIKRPPEQPQDQSAKKQKK